MSKLSEYGAKNIRDFLMTQQRDCNSKIRYLFEIPERENALSCYKFFNEHNQKVKFSKFGKESENEQTNDQKDEKSDTFKVKEQMKIYL